MSSRIFKKRVLKDLKNIKENPIENVQIYVPENNMKNWYFKYICNNDTSFNGGEYIGLIQLPDEYPFKAPKFLMLTPSGRFVVNKSICMSNSLYHAESWSPMWKLTSLIVGFISLFDDDIESHVGISHLKTTKKEKIRLAKLSKEYNLKLDINKFF